MRSCSYLFLLSSLFYWHCCRETDCTSFSSFSLLSVSCPSSSDQLVFSFSLEVSCLTCDTRYPCWGMTTGWREGCLVFFPFPDAVQEPNVVCPFTLPSRVIDSSSSCHDKRYVSMNVIFLVWCWTWWWGPTDRMDVILCLLSFLSIFSFPSRLGRRAIDLCFSCFSFTPSLVSFVYPNRDTLYVFGYQYDNTFSRERFPSLLLYLFLCRCISCFSVYSPHTSLTESKIKEHFCSVCRLHCWCRMNEEEENFFLCISPA